MRPIVSTLAVTTAALGLLVAPADAAARTACKQIASLAVKSCRLESQSDKRLEDGKCLQNTDAGIVRACQSDAKDTAKEEREECADRAEARLEVCDVLDEDVYEPVLDPADFVATITNPFAPFSPGRTWVYQGMTAEGLERIEIEVLSETRTILGIEATVVLDRAFLDGELVEETLDWLAQDGAGNVWYLGEVAQNFENGKLANLDGSWEAGVDGALPGIWTEGNPAVGDIYRQEFLLREAEDIEEVLSLSESVTVPAGSFTNCLQTGDYTPIEPGVFEQKFSASGVGLVLELNPATGERIELIEFTIP